MTTLTYHGTTALQQALYRGNGVATYIDPSGRRFEIINPKPREYRCGMMKSTTLEGLLSLINRRT